MNKLAPALLLFSLMLTACGEKPNAQDGTAADGTAGNSANASAQTGSANLPSTGSAPQAGHVDQPTTTPLTSSADQATTIPLTNSADQAATRQTGASSLPADIPKQYHMNKNYFIVPNDDNANKKVVLLTFDDGPKDKDMIESLLRTLDKHKAKAIFFVNGYRVKEHPEYLKLIADGGQIIGNHSWDHIELKKESNEKIKDQIIRVQDIVRQVTGITPQFFRPPFASSNDYVKQVVKDEGMLFMTWSNGSLDWDMAKIPEQDRPAALIKNVMDQLHPGSNILMHELPWTVKALDDLLTKLEEKGYSFVDPRAIELEMR